MPRRKKVNVCIEHLNSRDHSHPMKGHPGYQGDDLDYVAEIIRRVGSPRVKLLFDIYHVQIMNGDLIRRLEQTKDILGHVHTAGNPGRGELDDKQEIQYPPRDEKALRDRLHGLRRPGIHSDPARPSTDCDRPCTRATCEALPRLQTIRRERDCGLTRPASRAACARSDPA